MRRVFKLAVVVGGIGALAWGVRKRVRIAIGGSGAAEPNFQINEPPPEEPAGQMSAQAEEDVDPQPSADPDPDDAGPDSQDGAR